MAERKWLDALSQGDPAALGGIYEMYSERIFRYAFRMLGNRTDAEDATAETFLRVLRRSNELRADGACPDDDQTRRLADGSRRHEIP